MFDFQTICIADLDMLDDLTRRPRAVSAPTRGAGSAQHPLLDRLDRARGDRPLTFRELQRLAKLVWDLDLPDNYGFEHCPELQPPDPDRVLE